MHIYKSENSRAEKRTAVLKNILPIFLTTALGGTCYYLIEILFRGWSHPTMGILGGLCLYFIYLANRSLCHRTLLFRSVVGAIIITLAELTAGIILNLILDMGIWDYSRMPLNFLGQICFSMSVLWFLLSVAACVLCTFIRKYIFEYTSLIDSADGAMRANAVDHTDKNVGCEQR